MNREVAGEVRPARRHGQRGSSSMEFLGLAPVVLLIAVALLQAGFSLYGISATQTAARQAARAASLGEDPFLAADAALPGWLTLDDVTAVGIGNGVRVRTDLPDIVPGTDLTVTREAILP